MITVRDENDEWWAPQPRFRLLRKPDTTTAPDRLQQALLSNRGNLRWEDVPIVVSDEA